MERKARAILMSLHGCRPFPRRGHPNLAGRDHMADNIHGLGGLPSPKRGRPNRLSEEARKRIVQKVFQDLVHDLVGPMGKGKLQFWFEDEERMGQRGVG